MRKCAIYARYSSDLQRESSIEDQVRRCRDFAREKGWEVVEEWVVADRALSAAAIVGREGLKRLLEAAKAKCRAFDCLLVEDTSRLARDLADALRTTATLQFHSVTVVSVTPGHRLITGQCSPTDYATRNGRRAGSDRTSGQSPPRTTRACIEWDDSRGALLRISQHSN